MYTLKFSLFDFTAHLRNELAPSYLFILLVLGIRKLCNPSQSSNTKLECQNVLLEAHYSERA